MSSDQSLIYLIGETISIGDLLTMCEIEDSYKILYNDEDFWKNRTKKDYDLDDKLDEITWRDFYKDIYKNVILVFTVYYNKKIIGNTYSLHNISDLKERSFKLLSNKIGDISELQAQPPGGNVSYSIYDSGYNRIKNDNISDVLIVSIKDKSQI